jgi:hypothetical protein
MRIAVEVGARRPQRQIHLTDRLHHIGRAYGLAILKGFDRIAAADDATFLDPAIET